MSLLTKQEIYKRLKTSKFNLSKKQLTNNLDFTFNNFIRFTKKVDNSYGDENYINPSLWQMGHVIYFYLEHTISLLPIEKIIYDDFYSLDLSNFYDSKKTPLKYRNNSKYLLDYKTCITIYQKVIIILKDFINTNTINNIETYIIMLGVLHNEMHNEAFIFNSQSIFKKTINVINHKKNNSNIINEFTFIDYNEGEFSQGINDSEDNLIFDNEKPAFKKK